MCNRQQVEFLTPSEVDDLHLDGVAAEISFGRKKFKRKLKVRRGLLCANIDKAQRTVTTYKHLQSGKLVFSA